MTYLNKHGLPCPPCLIDLSNWMSEIFVSREQTSYLPPIYSLKIAPTNFGTMFIPFKTRLRFMGETLSKACFTSTSKEQTTNPNSSPFSLTAAAKNRMANTEKGGREGRDRQTKKAWRETTQPTRMWEGGGRPQPKVKRTPSNQRNTRRKREKTKRMKKERKRKKEKKHDCAICGSSHLCIRLFGEEWLV